MIEHTSMSSDNYIDELRDSLLLVVLAIPIGIVIGILDTLFGRLLLAIGDFRTAHMLVLLPFLSLAGLLIVYCYTSFGGESGKGMGLVFAAGHDDSREIPLRLIPFVTIGTWLTHLFGGSAGREGVAVQIGAAVSHYIGKRILVKNAPKILLIAGMAAGFSGLFRTPVAAVLFALEVLTVGTIEVAALFPAIAAAYAACTTSRLLGLEKFSFALQTDVAFDWATGWKLSVLGALFGIVGGLFAAFLKWGREFSAQKLPNPLRRVIVLGVALTLLLLICRLGRYTGLGTNLIEAAFSGGDIYFYDWILKMVFTVVTLAAGFQGGEVTPLFSIGASLGVLLADPFGLPVELAAALGYASVFGGATNTFFAPVLIGAEVFGYEYLPFFFVVCAVAYLFNGNQCIYSGQKAKSV